MLSSYSVNQAGPSHMLRGVPWQDSYSVQLVCDGGVIVAAVADGLGSESHSDIGSFVASHVSVKYVADSLEDGDAEGLIETIREAFCEAYDAVLAEAARRDESAGEYDSTLCLAVFKEGTLWWGHSGDSGLICSHTDGTYQLVTRMQRDDEGRVFPLCFSERWEFGKVENVSTFLLCTDGILEVLAPPILQTMTDQAVDTRLVRMFLHPQKDDADHLEELEAGACEYWTQCDPAVLDDDKTMVVVFDVENPPATQDESYYGGPDWAEIKKQIDELLYPQSASDEKHETEDLPLDSLSDDAASRLGSSSNSVEHPKPADRTHHHRRSVLRTEMAADATEEMALLLIKTMARGASVTAECLLFLADIAAASAEDCLEQLEKRKR